MSRCNNQRGIILWETLSALLILTLVGSAVLLAMQRTYISSAALQTGVCANWVAQNKLVQMQLEAMPPHPPYGKTEQCNKNWTWTIKQVPDALYGLSSFNLKVYDESENEVISVQMQKKKE
ncbi:type II secretion system protein [Serratia quinivorans]|uniref:type II secretion system protein n=1 Tax=Serratia quinivorans TaxID=137545 RepID=UPI002177293B|nr:type II secretion system protein [Serratia quinivorans]CAI1114508.1 type II secretion system protein I [Serratia quinivorans]CAI1876056.1 type II secretion system protein I [Serratia quinivorans]